MSLIDRYRRLLRWYPPEWRQRNERVVLDTYAEQAEATGRTKPPFGDVVSIVVHGLALRANDRMAVFVATAALVLVAIAELVSRLLPDTISRVSDHTLLGTAFLLLVLAAAIPLLHRKLISPARVGAAVVVGLAFSALLRVVSDMISSPTEPWLLELFASRGWAAPLLLVLGGWALFAALAACLLIPVLSSQLGRAGGISLGALIGVALATGSPFLVEPWAMAALGLTVFVIAAWAMGPAYRTPPVSRLQSKRTVTLVIVLASLVVGLVLPLATDGGIFFSGVDALLPYRNAMAFGAGAVAAGAMARVFFQDRNPRGGIAVLLLLLSCTMSFVGAIVDRGEMSATLSPANEALLIIAFSFAVLGLLDHSGRHYPLWTVLPFSLGVFGLGFFALVVQALPSFLALTIVLCLQYLRPGWRLPINVGKSEVPNPLAGRAS